MSNGGDVFELEEFTCPECGSHHFEDNPKTGGCCHGYLPSGQPCRFHWEPSERNAYFRKTGETIPRTVAAKAVK